MTIVDNAEGCLSPCITMCLCMPDLQVEMLLTEREKPFQRHVYPQVFRFTVHVSMVDWRTGFSIDRAQLVRAFCSVVSSVDSSALNVGTDAFYVSRRSCSAILTWVPENVKISAPASVFSPCY